MYLTNYDSYGNCSNPCYVPPVNNCPVVVNQCPTVCQPQVVYQPYYVQNPVVQQPIIQQPIIQQPIIQQGPQLQYNWIPSNIYNMKWPIRGNINNPL